MFKKLNDHALKSLVAWHDSILTPLH